MPTPDELQQIFALAQSLESLAQQVFQRAQSTLPAAALNQAYQDYLATMQKARDMYYAASHALAQPCAAGPDLARLNAATKDLQGAVAKLQGAEKIVSASLRVLTVAGTIAAAVIDPTHVSALAALASVAQVAASFAGK